MHWSEKFEIISTYLETRDDITDDFFIKKEGASSDAITTLHEKYPFISEEYIEFIKITDGADIAQCRLYSTTEYSMGEKIYSSEYPGNIWFPFGHEAGGDPLLLHRTGKIAIGYAKSASGRFEYLSEDFSQFLSEVLMGSLYPSIFRINRDSFNKFIEEELDAEEDPWLSFLVEREWLQT